MNSPSFSQITKFKDCYNTKIQESFDGKHKEWTISINLKTKKVSQNIVHSDEEEVFSIFNISTYDDVRVYTKDVKEISKLEGSYNLKNGKIIRRHTFTDNWPEPSTSIIKCKID